MISRPTRTCAFAILLAMSSLALAESEEKTGLKLQSHEPNIVGWNKDEEFDGHLDVKLSLRYPLRNDADPKGTQTYLRGFYPYLAFTGRFSQYIGSQDSSPVVGRRFNPELFVRTWGGGDKSYLDLGYGHESNGQSVNSAAEYEAMRRSLANDGDDPDFADKFISRGWDYIGITWKTTRQFQNGRKFSVYLPWRLFLRDGLFQGEAEDYFEFEDADEPKERAEYDGISILFRYDSKIPGRAKLALKYTTGYKELFRNNTLRFEATKKLGPLPLSAWYQVGYNSDLASYYVYSNSYGVGFEFDSKF